MADTWSKYAKRLIKSELLKREISTEDLIILLDGIGVQETKSSISSKISRGTFSASFLFQVLSVIGCKSLDLLKPTELNFKTQIKNQVRLNLK